MIAGPDQSLWQSSRAAAGPTSRPWVNLRALAMARRQERVMMVMVVVMVVERSWQSNNNQRLRKASGYGQQEASQNGGCDKSVRHRLLLLRDA